MPNLPIRGLGSVGVVTDVDPYNLPINGFTRGKNIRFNEGKVSHGPVFRDASPNSQVANPMFCVWHTVFYRIRHCSSSRRKLYNTRVQQWILFTETHWDCPIEPY